LSELKTKIIKTIIVDEEDDALSLTAISKAVGYSKKNDKVTEIIKELVEKKVFREITKSGRTLYYVAEEEDSSSDTIMSMPSNASGYDININQSNGTAAIKCAGDKCEVQLEADERLLVINNDNTHRYKVANSDDVLKAIKEYSDEKGIGTFLVTDLIKNTSVANPSDVNLDSAVILLGVERYNKAG